MNKKLIGAGAGAIVLMAAAAAIASYSTRESLEQQPQTTAVAHHPERHLHQQRVASAAPAPQCNDHNVVGTVVGGVGGGVVGSQIGRGNGKTAATIGGVLGGAFLGNRYIPTRNVTCGQ